MYDCSTTLNYVWINRRSFSSVEAGNSNPIQDRYTKNVLKVANEYPDIMVKLWIDHALLDDAAKEFLSQLSDGAKNKNMEIHDLHEIPAYQKHPVFRETENPVHEHLVIWKKVDLARLLVLQHVFETTDAKDVFYSDFDIFIPPVGASYTAKALDEFGMTFGKIQTPRHGWCLENSFIGFRRGSEAFLLERLIPGGLAAIANDEKDCFWQFRYAVTNQFTADAQDRLVVPVTQMAGVNSVGISNQRPVVDRSPPPNNMRAKSLTVRLFSGLGFFFQGG